MTTVSATIFFGERGRPARYVTRLAGHSPRAKGFLAGRQTGRAIRLRSPEAGPTN
jgi:hypothetical protein